MTTRVDKSIRLDFSRVDVVDFLEELGLRNVEDKGLEVFYSCPFPGHTHEDKTPSASMKQGTTVAYCFTCGWRGNALKFLADFEGVSPLLAARWIRQRFGDDFQEPEGSFLEEIDTIFAGTRKREDTTNGILDDFEAFRRSVDWTFTEQILLKDPSLVPEHLWYVLDRGFLPWVLDKFEIGWDAISQRIVIPYRDAKGRLLGFKGRAYLEGQLPRYWVLGGSEYGFESFNVSRALWGLHSVLQSDTYKVRQHAIVVEGELNALAMHQHGYDNAIGISGKRLSDAQVDLIKKHFSSATFILDEYEDMVAAAEKLQPYMPVYIVADHNDDPADMFAAEIKELLSSQQNLLLNSLPSA